MPTGRTLAVALTGLLAHGASGLYADEVGKLDWHQQNLGRFASAAFDGGGRLTVVGEVKGVVTQKLKLRVGRRPGVTLCREGERVT